MRIVFQVTDVDVRENVRQALKQIEEDTEVTYPDDNESTKIEVIECATDYICDRYERSDNGYLPNYYMIVYDTLKDYYCIVD